MSGAAEPISPSRPAKPVQATETPHPTKTSPDLAPTPDHIVPEVKDLTLSELLDRAQPQPQPQPKAAGVQPMSPVAGMGTDKALIHSVLSKYAAAKAPLKSEPEEDIEGESRATSAPVSKAVMPTGFLASIELTDAVRARNIPNLVHFTRCENLSSILQHGLHSVESSEACSLEPVKNDPHRYDGQRDGTSLSISFPNSLMFYKYRMMNPKVRWSMLLIDPAVIYHKRCGFYPLNAADARMSRLPRETMQTTEAFERMFSEEWSARPNYLRAHDTTDVQAEVMVYENIGPEYFQGVVFETLADLATYRDKVPGFEVFAVGEGEGIFGPRERRLRSLV